MPAKILVIFLFLLISLLTLQRRLWCACHEMAIWITDVATSHCSQHVFDPYSFSHMQHGLVFFFVLYLLKRPKLELALLIESLWEILENTPFVIERYRTTTSSLNYYGDTISNSMGDLFACGIGFFIATKVSWRVSLLLYVGIEVIMLATIRDSLALNVLMLIYPLQSIKEWQISS